MKIAVIGGGAGGAAAVAELSKAGHDVSFWSRSADTLAPFQALGGIAYDGVLGEGVAHPRLMTSDLAAAIAGVDVAAVVLPTLSHASVARELAKAGWPKDKPVLLNPGHTGGALEFAHAFAGVNPAVPPIVEFSTLTYVARKYSADKVTVTGRAKQVRAAAMPGAEQALEIAAKLFPGATPVGNVLMSSLANANLVLHPPGAILAAAWVEAREGDFTFYVDAMTPGVARVMRQLDDERRAVAEAFGFTLPNIVDEMKLIGTVEAGIKDSNDLVAAIAGGEANKRIKGPNSLQHRYYREDFGHGLLPFLDLARIAGVKVPIASALFDLAGSLCGVDFRPSGRTAESMGIVGLTKSQLLKKVTGQ
ncbi:MAG: NAD/NADP octopine/nopaline dehydrogenase family protein [Pseudolabrys sp.]|nr:NAD/NADP octopine/nopaline dehydrogenase family protein [Pseudolabrys sp.]